MAAWVRDPHAGGVPIPDALKRETTRRLLAHAEKHYVGKYTSIEIRFRGSFCYIDANTKGRNGLPIHLCRLRYCGQDQWSVAFFTYSSESYKPCAFGSGSFFGTPEEGFDVGAVYLT